MLLFRNAKTKEIMVGAEDRVEQCHYAAVVTRIEEDMDNELTGGWKVVEVCILYSTFVLLVGRGKAYAIVNVDGSKIGSCIPLEIVTDAQTKKK